MLVASEFLSLSASFFKVLPLPEKFNRFHIPDWDGKFLEDLTTKKYVDRLPGLPQKFNRFRFHIPDGMVSVEIPDNQKVC